MTPAVPHNDNSYFLLYGYVAICRGANRATLIDLRYHKFKVIPNLLGDIIDSMKVGTVAQTKQLYENSMDEGIDKYLQVLQAEQWGHFTLLPLGFKAIETSWFSYATISNAIVEVGNILTLDEYEKISKELTYNNCIALELRIPDQMEIDMLLAILIVFCKQATLSCIHVNIIYQSDIDYLHFFTANQNLFNSISTISIFNSNKTDVYEIGLDTALVFLTKEIEFSKACGLIDMKYFSPTMEAYTESLYHNSCLNRKVSIDRYGEIKNCPSMAMSYGNIRNTSLEEALGKNGFKDLWNISKDQISICRDCEFRHMCTDCRAYRQNPDDLYSKPLKCGYNPYTNQWEDWSINALSQLPIEFYNLTEIK